MKYSTMLKAKLLRVMPHANRLERKRTTKLMRLVLTCIKRSANFFEISPISILFRI